MDILADMKKLKEITNGLTYKQRDAALNALIGMLCEHASKADDQMGATPAYQLGYIASAFARVILDDGEIGDEYKEMAIQALRHALECQ